MSFEAESNSELTDRSAIPVAFPISGAKQNTQTKIFVEHRIGSIVGPCDFLPARSDEFQKVCE